MAKTFFTKIVTPLLQVGSTATPGYVLTADSSGNGTWQAAGASSGVAPYSATIGDGATNPIVVTHNLNTRDVFVMVRQAATPYEQVLPTVASNTVNTIVLTFASAPASNQYQVLVATGAAPATTGITTGKAIALGG